MKSLSRLFTVLVFVFLFAPIAILLVFSFNESKSLSVFSGFSLKWYQELFQDTNTLISVRNTLILAFSAMVISTVMGTAASVGISRLRRRWYRRIMDTVTDIPMTNPDIITGISLMLMFVFVGQLFGSATSLSFSTMLIAHVTFCLPYVILQVLPKLQQLDPALPEAAQDLGCTPLRAFFKVTLPEISPGILTGAIMAFTMSLDDFVISYFTSGNGFQTLPISIYNMTKKTVTPKMYALATIIFFVILALLLLNNLTDNDDSRTLRERRKRAGARRPLRRRVWLPVGGAVLVGILALCISTAEKPLELNVYNWGEYISDGSEGCYDTIKEFEAWYQSAYGRKIRVHYTTFASCEDMYNKLSSGAVSYDVVIPSDYMIARMAEEDMLLPLNFDNIPNYKNIDETFRGLYYDPENLYTVPYAYGIVGIIYNANEVDAADAEGWELMWNPRYTGRILQFNNPRDAFGTAIYRLGLDVNTTDRADWDAACEALMAQRPLRYGLVMDEIYNMMESGEAAIGAYYAGDYFTMVDAQAEDVDLQFYYPDPTNFYVDAMCIPSCAEHKELAEIFINFMLDHDAAVANAEYTYYASPNKIVYTDPVYIEDMGEETMDVLYPGFDDFAALYNRYAYRNLDQSTLDYMNSLWESVKIN